MAFVIADRIKETSTTTGTGTFTLAGAVAGFRSFASVGNANTTSYLIVAVDANGVPTGEWETGIGTYTASGTTLARTSLIASSTGSAINFAAGTKHVICTDVAGYTTPLAMTTTANRAIQVADQTALSSTSGNARGTGAIDLQVKRSSATRVSSGLYSTIGGGRNNTASGTDATVSGGQIGIASGSKSTVCGGYYCTASGYAAVTLGGYKNTSSGYFASALGTRAIANKYGQMTHASGRFSADGDAQRSEFVLRRSTTSATPVEVFLNGSSAMLVVPNDTTWAFEVLVVARRTDANDESAIYKFIGGIDRNASAATTALVGTVTKTVVAEDTAAWDVEVDADTTNGSLRIMVTGEAAKTVRFVAYVWTVEVTG